MKGHGHEPSRFREGGFSESDLNLMFKENPARLIKLPVV
jgi:hypothetical protein